uniref:Skp1 domain-containing protein n=1 Tax=Panagrellus redivivus TaxID=6233 RepID=A0A7E4W779_PANRE
MAFLVREGTKVWEEITLNKYFYATKTCWLLTFSSSGKDTKELRELFELRNDYTEQEEADIRKKHEVTA